MRVPYGLPDSSINVWQIETNGTTSGGHLMRTLDGHRIEIQPTAFVFLKPSGGQLASGANGDIKLWNVESGQCVRSVDRAHRSWISALERIGDNDGARLASGSSDYLIKVWRLSDFRCLRTLSGHSAPIKTLKALYPQRLASGAYDAHVKIWNLDNGECVRTLHGHTVGVTALVVLSNGMLASGSADDKIRVWDTDSGECVRALQTYTNGVWAMLALDNNRAVSGSQDHTLAVWDMNTGTCLKRLVGHTRSVIALHRVSRSTIASVSLDHTIKLWDLSTYECVRTLTNAVEEPGWYFPGDPRK